MPASYNDLLADPRVRDHVGDVWYQTDGPRAPRAGPGERVVLRFDVGHPPGRRSGWATQEVVRHEGGYTPFEADVTAVRPPGRGRADHRLRRQPLTWQSIPPGIVEQTPAGRRQRTSTTSSTTPGCTARCGSPAHPRPGSRTSRSSPASTARTGTVEYRVEPSGGRRLGVRVVLRDADGAPVATGTGAAGVLTVPDVHPWAPGDGYLYDLRGRARRPGGRARRQLHQRVGVRTVEVRGTAVPDQRRAVPLHRLRHARGPRRSAARATTTRSWSTTSR